MKYANTVLALSACLVLGACNQSSKFSDIESVNLNISLVDAPIDNISNVFVDIDHIEMQTKSEGKSKKIVFGEKIGLIDLLKLRDGVSLPITDLKLPASTEIKNLRLILKDKGHSITSKDGSSCELKTPSAEQSGLKMALKDIVLEGGHDYKMVVDFDAARSIVFPGDGGCLLKPVVRVKSLLKIEPAEGSDEPISTIPEEEMIDPSEPQNPQEVAVTEGLAFEE